MLMRRLQLASSLRTQTLKSTCGTHLRTHCYFVQGWDSVEVRNTKFILAKGARESTGNDVGLVKMPIFKVHWHVFIEDRYPRCVQLKKKVHQLQFFMPNICPGHKREEKVVCLLKHFYNHQEFLVSSSIWVVELEIWQGGCSHKW